jgi:WhiB family redox-sensing transcriptional regulator
MTDTPPQSDPQLIDEAPNWRQSAACRGMNAEMFHPFSERDFRLGESRAVCAGCPVRDECGEYGIAHEEFGVYGGLSENERRKIRRERQIRLESGAHGAVTG